MDATHSVPNASRGPVTGRSGQALPLGVGALIGLAALAVLLVATVLEIQAGATAYIVGESLWTKAQQDAVHYLYRYTMEGEPADLQRVREALKVPMGDRIGRLAMERRPRDLATARAGLIQGRNAPEDTGRLIWMYRYFANAPYFRDSVRNWRDGEVEILTLAALADEVEQSRRRGSLDAIGMTEFRRRLLDIDRRVRPLEVAFSQSLLSATRFLRLVLLIASATIFMLLAWSASMVLHWTTRRIEDSERKFRAAFHQAAVGMAKMDRDGNFVEINEALCGILGQTHADLCKKRYADLLLPEDLAQLNHDGDGAIAWETLDKSIESRFLRHDGSALWCRWTVSVIRIGHKDKDKDRAGDRVFAIIKDVSEAHALSVEMAHQASHDTLTGLVNRREIERRLQLALASSRSTGERHALCFVDLDMFKLVNDTCGHEVGDKLLRQLAGTIELQLRESDWIGRLGGDEFAIFLGRTSIEGAERAAEKINEALATTAFTWEGRSFNVTCCVGVVEMNAETPDVSWLLRAADTACYLAKGDGRNRVRTYRESDEAVTRRRGEMQWVGEIRNAISDNRLLLYAQRIEPLRGRGGAQYEVLVRLANDAGEIFSPGAFLPAAERYGEAMAIDRWVFATLVAQLCAHPQHLERLERCHVNVSAQAIASPEFRGFVAQLLDESQLPAHKLCFEITETAAISNLTEARLFIDAMRGRGCLIALDDFGSGLSSFGYLKNLTVDILKIDGVFVRDMADDAVDFALVRAICEVGRALGKTTIAEWVANDRVLAKLREVDVDYVQGYAIHVPCPLAELIDEEIHPAEEDRAKLVVVGEQACEGRNAFRKAQ